METSAFVVALATSRCATDTSCPGTTVSRVTSMTASVITATRPFLIPKTGFAKTRSRVLAHIATLASRKEKAVPYDL